MTYIYLLSYNRLARDNEENIAAAECLCLTDGSCVDERLFASEKYVDANRAGFIMASMELLIHAARDASLPEASVEGLLRAVEQADIVATTFSVNLRKIPPSLPENSVQIRDAVGWRIGGAADLTSPEVEFLVIATRDAFWLGRVISRSKKIWEKHSKKPRPYTRGLPARLARAMINLGAEPGDRIVDPCCGSGTFLIEAAEMGIQAAGFDINEKMVDGSNLNLRHFGYPEVAAVADARALKGQWDAIVTDLPYGHMKDYRDFDSVMPIIENMSALASRAVVVMGDDYAQDFERLGWEVRDVITVTVSKKLVRHIHVVTRRN